MKVSEVVAQNVKMQRAMAGMSQSDLAEAVARVGLRWGQRTVSDIESYRRPVDVDELASLSLAFGCTLAVLLDVIGPAGIPEPLEHGDFNMSGTQALLWMRGRALVKVDSEGAHVRPIERPPMSAEDYLSRVTYREEEK